LLNVLIAKLFNGPFFQTFSVFFQNIQGSFPLNDIAIKRLLNHLAKVIKTLKTLPLRHSPKQQ